MSTVATVLAVIEAVIGLRVRVLLLLGVLLNLTACAIAVVSNPEALIADSVELSFNLA